VSPVKGINEPKLGAYFFLDKTHYSVASLNMTRLTSTHADCTEKSQWTKTLLQVNPGIGGVVQLNSVPLQTQQ